MRKLLRVIFSRYFISLIFIVCEFAIMLYLAISAGSYSVGMFIFFIILNLLAVISLINRDANPEYKVSWLVVILLLPFFGLILYLCFYSRRESKKNALLMQEIHRALNEDTDYGKEELERIKSIDKSAHGKAAALLESDPLASVYTNTDCRYFPLGEEMFDSMLKDIESAEKFVFLEYFIIKDGVMWQKLSSLLSKKAKEGVEVRLIYDDIGCMNTLPDKFDDKMREYNIKCTCFGPITPKISAAHNNRDHRKITVIDGKIAYTGGINLADEYINEKTKFGHWKDGGVRVCGDAAKGFLRLFLSSWNFSHGAVENDEKYLNSPREPATRANGFFIPFGSGPAPIYPRPTGKNALLNLIHQAVEYIYITTPYLIVDYDLTEALRCAALRGVDVRIIAPNEADKRLVKIMTKSSYAYLMEAGVKIYEYTPGFIHEKLVVCDGLYAMIGTINLDYRSLAHHFEDAVWIYGSAEIERIHDEFLKTVSLSKEQDEKAARLGSFERILRNVIRIFAPLL